MPKEIFRFIGTQDAEEGGSALGVADLDARSIQINSKIAIRHLAAAYSFVLEDTGNIFVIDAALTFTLPAVTVAGMKGVHVWITVGADVNLTVTATATQLSTFNNAAATSVAFSTSGNKIGAGVHLFCDGVKWFVLPYGANTMTVS